MQLTHFDRWLREKFVYQTHIHTLRPPASLPAGIRAMPALDPPAHHYPCHFVASHSKAGDALIRQLKHDGQMYATRVVDRKAWYVPLIAPAGVSLTWRLATVLVVSTSTLYGLRFLKGLVESPEFSHNFQEALKILNR